MASCDKAFSGRPTNSGSTQPGTAHLDGGVIGCHQCLHLAFVMCSSISRHSTSPLGFVPCIPSSTAIHDATQPTIAMSNCTHSLNVTNSSASGHSEIEHQPLENHRRPRKDTSHTVCTPDRPNATG